MARRLGCGALGLGREVRWIRRGQQLWATHRDEQSSGIMAGVGLVTQTVTLRTATAGGGASLGIGQWQQGPVWEEQARGRRKEGEWV